MRGDDARYAKLTKNKLTSKVINNYRNGNNEKQVDLHAIIEVKVDVKENEVLVNKMIKTSVGRVIFNQLVPHEYGFIDQLLTKKALRDIIGEILKVTGTAVTSQFLDDIKSLGFNMAFRGGLSFNLGNVLVPEIKTKLVEDANAEVEQVLSNYNMGFITNNERYN